MTESSKIQTFPFADLPQYTQNDVALQKRVLKHYSFLEDSRDFFAHFVAPFRHFFPEDFKINLLQVKSSRLDGLEAQFAHAGLYSLIKVLPHNQFAFLAFDPILAKVMVTTALSGGKVPTPLEIGDHLRPLTALEEGVVEYLVVSCLQQIEKQFQQKDFSLVFETMLGENQKLTQYFSLQDEFAVFSFLVSHPKKDFHFQLALPLKLGQDLGWDRSGADFVQLRTHDFSKFRIDFQLEVGQVVLSSAELHTLSEGDIVLLDETLLTSLDPVVSGRAFLTLESSPQKIGYEVELGVRAENLIAEIKGVL